MPTYMARSVWEGTLKGGSGQLEVGSGSFESAVSPKPSQNAITNPEEVVGAALASCYAMALTKTLTDAGHEPKSVRASAAVSLEVSDGRPSIPRISLDVEVDAPGLSEAELDELSGKADRSCPVSQALRATDIHIVAHLPKSGVSGKER